MQMFILQESRRDWYLVAMVLLLSIGANLPEQLTENIYINRQFLIVALAVLIAVSLVRYLKFALLLVVVILALGANLPEEIADEFGVNKTLLIFCLVLMVVTSFANKYLKLDTGLNKKSGNSNLHGATALFKAISYGRTDAVEKLIESGVNVNVRTVTGITPLILAASKGYHDVVRVLLEHGARASTVGKDGKTAVVVAQEMGHTRIVELFRATDPGAVPDFNIGAASSA
jgi:hypothetical protein